MAFASLIRRRGVALVIAGPSGVGKSSITEGLLAAEPEATRSVSVTTRAPRAGESEGVHYAFRDPSAFDALVAAGALLEWAEVFGHRYGTPRASVMQALEEGRDVLFDIDWQGHRRLRSALPGDVVSLFVLPDSRTTLEGRLAGRGDLPEVRARRMVGAAGEIGHWREFDHVLVNQDLEATIGAVRAILAAARLVTARQVGLARFVAGLG
ncbi:MAG: guanylate kinase [Rhodospirillales bacterium]|nr:guanylate kinase [Rhodospirillales bacterium]